MIYYDWTRLYLAGNKNPKKIIKIFAELVARKKTANTNKIYSSRCTHYILDEQKFIDNESKATIDEQCVALHIASKRNYLMCKLIGESGVYYPLIQDIYDLDKLKLNRLLTIENNKIYLKHENRRKQ